MAKPTVYVGGNPVGLVDPLGLKECDEGDDDCFANCLVNNYGDLYETASYFDPITFVNLSLNEFSNYTSDRIKKQATRILYSTSSYYAGRRQAATIAQFGRFNAAMAIVGAGAFGFMRGAELYCTVECF